MHILIRVRSRFRNTVLAFRASEGFSLLELAIVISVIALILGITASMGSSTIESARISQTRRKIELLHEAIYSYVKRNRRLPCPADQALTISSSNYGQEAANKGRCVSGTPAATYSNGATYPVVEGMVPYKALGLGEDFSYDGWGRRLTYSVLTTLTEPEAFVSHDRYENCTAITVNDATGAARTTTAVYALLSHGQNGHGAFTKGASRYNDGSTNTNELANCNCDSSGVYDGTYNASYVQQTMVTSGSVFDDLVEYRERWQMPIESDIELKYYVGPELAAAHFNSPFVSFISYDCGTYTKDSDPATLPTGNAREVSVSYDNMYWAVSHFNSPYVTIYKRNELTGAMTKLADPGSLPNGNAYDLDFGNQNNYLAVGHDDPGTSAYLSIYSYSTTTDTFSKLAWPDGPTYYPPSLVVDVSFNSDDSMLAVAHLTGPYYVQVYVRSGDVFQAINVATQFSTPPAGAVNQVVFSDDGQYLILAHQNSPYITIYEIAYTPALTFTKLADPAVIPSSEAEGAAFATDTLYMAAVGYGGTDSMILWEIEPTTDTFTEVPMATSSANNLDDVEFSPRRYTIGMVGQSSQEVQMMDYIPGDNIMTLRNIGAAGNLPGDSGGMAFRERNLKNFRFKRR